MPSNKATLTERVAQLERQLAEMRDMIAAQTAKLEVAKPAAEPAKAMAAAAGATTSVATKPAKGPVPVPAPAKKQVQEEGVSPEILVVIAAAVAHFMGKSVRIRSARLVHPSGTNPWAQQGRVFVQASHNLALQR